MTHPSLLIVIAGNKPYKTYYIILLELNIFNRYSIKIKLSLKKIELAAKRPSKSGRQPSTVWWANQKIAKRPSDGLQP